MSTAEFASTFRPRPRGGVIALLVVLSFVLPHIPLLNLIALPVSSFTTTIHEMSHAAACLLTGGHVAGMSIVNDGEGHGGLTYCLGGWPLLYAQTGYLGTALAGSLFIFLGRYPKLSRGVLACVGAAFAIAGVIFTLGTVLQGQVISGFESMVVTGLIGGALIFAACKLNFYYANLLLLFLGVQTGLNALNDDGILVAQAFGAMPGSWSDASNMQSMTGIPAPLWAAFWTMLAFVMLGGTLYICQKLDKARF